MILHTVNKSPFSHQACQDCLARYAPGDSIILLEDGVYAGMQTSPVACVIKAQTLYALREDVDARGIAGKLLPTIKLIDYAEFVTLCTQHKLVQAWF